MTLQIEQCHIFLFVFNLIEAHSQAIVPIPRKDLDFRLLNLALGLLKTIGPFDVGLNLFSTTTMTRALRGQGLKVKGLKVIY